MRQTSPLRNNYVQEWTAGCPILALLQGWDSTNNVYRAFPLLLGRLKGPQFVNDGEPTAPGTRIREEVSNQNKDQPMISLRYDTLSCRVLSFAVLLLCLPTLALCQNRDPVHDRIAEEESIREAVIRKQMEDWITHSDDSEAKAKDDIEKSVAKLFNFRVFFVSINNQDPSNSLVKRLQDIHRIVKKVSASEISKTQRTPVIDRVTGQRGIIFAADKIRWLKDDAAQVEGGYYCDGLCAAGIVFEVGREGGRWVVKNKKLQWIS